MKVLYLLNKLDLYRMRNWLIHVFPNIVNHLLQRFAFSKRLFALHPHLLCSDLQYLIISVLLYRVLFESFIKLLQLLFLTLGVTYTCISINLFGILLHSASLLRAFLVLLLAVSNCLVDRLFAFLDRTPKALQSFVLLDELLPNAKHKVSQLAWEEDKLCVLVVSL